MVKDTLLEQKVRLAPLCTLEDGRPRHMGEPIPQDPFKRSFCYDSRQECPYQTSSKGRRICEYFTTSSFL